MGLLKLVFCFFTTVLIYCVFLPEVYSFGIRPFVTSGLSSSGTNCSTETAFAGLGCPCKLQGQACNKPNLGFRCNSSGICTCGSGFQLIGGSCYQLYNIAPSITPNQAVHGVGVPCSLLTNDNVPGLNIKFSGGVPPYACTTTVVASALDDPNLACAVNQGPVTDCGTADLVDQCLGVDAVTGAVYVNTPGCPVGPITQDIQVICVDSRGIQSNDPPTVFRVNFPLCYPTCS